MHAPVGRRSRTEGRTARDSADGGWFGGAADRHGQDGRGEGWSSGQRQRLRPVRRRSSGPVHRRQEEASGEENQDHRDGEWRRTYCVKIARGR